jgi:hypothetical protein
LGSPSFDLPLHRPTERSVFGAERIDADARFTLIAAVLSVGFVLEGMEAATDGGVVEAEVVGDLAERVAVGSIGGRDRAVAISTTT